MKKLLSLLCVVSMLFAIAALPASTADKFGNSGNAQHSYEPREADIFDALEVLKHLANIQPNSAAALMGTEELTVFNALDILKGLVGITAPVMVNCPRNPDSDNPSDENPPALENPPLTDNPAVVAEVGDIIPFGGYDWRVLDVQGGKALIITENVLESREYHSIYASITWENCALRDYLNGEFYDAFSAAEKGLIAETDVINADSYWNTPGGNDTTDKVFLLSVDEANRYFYHEDEDGIEDDSLRIAYDQDGNACRWWLRTPGNLSEYAAFVLPRGAVYEVGFMVSYNNNGEIAFAPPYDYENYTEDCGCGVRPALWLNLSAASGSVEDTDKSPVQGNLYEPIAVDPSEYYPALTVEDIKRLNGGNDMDDIFSDIYIRHFAGRYGEFSNLIREIKGKFTTEKILTPKDAVLALTSVRDIMQIDDISYYCREVEPREHMGFNIFSLVQLYKGVPVDGGGFRVIAAFDGTPVSVEGYYVSEINLDVTPMISSEEAEQSVDAENTYTWGMRGEAIQMKGVSVTGSRLVVCDFGTYGLRGTVNTRLCWVVEVGYANGYAVRHAVIDAHSGETLNDYSLLIS